MQLEEVKWVNNTTHLPTQRGHPPAAQKIHEIWSQIGISFEIRIFSGSAYDSFKNLQIAFYLSISKEGEKNEKKIYLVPKVHILFA